MVMHKARDTILALLYVLFTLDLFMLNIFYKIGFFPLDYSSHFEIQANCNRLNGHVYQVGCNDHL